MTIMGLITAVIAVGQLAETYVLIVLADPAAEGGQVEAMAEEVATKAFPFQPTTSHPMEEVVQANRMAEVHQALRSNQKDKVNGAPRREKSLLL